MASIVTVIIPTHQRPNLLRLCLGALKRSLGAVPVGSIDVIVSDDSHDDMSRVLVQSEFPWARHVQGPRRGPASNRNCGAAMSSSPWLVFMDDDCIPDPGWLAAYLQAFATHPDQPLFEGRTRADRARRSNTEEAPINETGGYLWSCNMAIRTGLFQGLQGFCESFPHAALEDVDFRLRLARQGHFATFVPQACVCHPYRPRRGLAHQRNHNASYAHLLKRHPDLVRALSWRGILLDMARLLKAAARDGWHYGLPGTGRSLYAILSKTYLDARCLVARGQGSR
jgi:GT2 family glycosyltransferase